jgi:hypothetical protein
MPWGAFTCRKSGPTLRLEERGLPHGHGGGWDQRCPGARRRRCLDRHGAGSDIAKETAGIILLRPSLEGIVSSILLSRAILKTIRQNLFFAFAYNILGIPIAAGLLYPFFGILLSPIIAAAAMSLSSVSVIVNSLRLKSERSTLSPSLRGPISG